MSTPTIKPWTDDDARTVLDLIADGRTPREIAEAYGITKNAVIGRIHRSPALLAAMRLRGPLIRIDEPAPAPAKPKRPAAIKQKALVASATIAIWPTAKNRPDHKVPPHMPDPAPPLTDMRRVPLLDLRKDWCKWPIEENKAVIGHYLFCGRDTGGPSYCAEHAARAAGRDHG